VDVVGKNFDRYPRANWAYVTRSMVRYGRSKRSFEKNALTGKHSLSRSEGPDDLMPINHYPHWDR
jgi:hypothetical protein